MIIKELSEAIINRYRQYSELNSVLTGMFFYNAPQGQAYPYIVFRYRDMTFEQFLGGADDRMYKVDIKFIIYSNIYDGGYDATSLMEYVKNCFDLNDFAIENYRLVKFGLESISPIMYIDDVMQIEMNYECWLVKE